MTPARRDATPVELPKCPTGIPGLDDITAGGLPRGRATLVCGRAGCGKTLLGMHFLVQGATLYDEPGVLVTFEESAAEVAANVRSLGFDLASLLRRKKIAIDAVRIDRRELEAAGDYDLEALFVRLRTAIASVGAKRVVLDTIEALFGGFANAAVLRAELSRLCLWLKDAGVTAMITAEQGDQSVTRHGIEEYVTDCVIFLDHRCVAQSSTRRLRILKYRGSAHGTNEYPFLIDEHGISMLPVSSLALNYPASNQRVSSGVPRLDRMLGGNGYYRGSTVLVSGTAGSGKTSMAAHFARAACERGERCLYFLFEESPAQLMRNMRTIGLDLRTHVQSGLLRFAAARPTMFGLEMHLVSMLRVVDEFSPQVAIIDPISSFTLAGNEDDVKAMLMRVVDHLKGQGVTAFLVSLTDPGRPLERTDAQISSFIDTWLLLRDVELNAERNRVLYILKSRGMAHSNQLREFRLSNRGIELLDVYLGPSGVLTGSSRIVQEAADRAQQASEREALEQQRVQYAARRRTLESRVAALQAEMDAEQRLFDATAARLERQRASRARDRIALAKSRRSEDPSHAGPPGRAARTGRTPTPKGAA